MMEEVLAVTHLAMAICLSYNAVALLLQQCVRVCVLVCWTGPWQCTCAIDPLVGFA